MKARDAVSPVITVAPTASVKDVAKLFLERRISAVPVVDDQGKLIGIVSEGDLLHGAAEAGTQRQRPWWLRALAASWRPHSPRVAFGFVPIPSTGATDGLRTRTAFTNANC